MDDRMSEAVASVNDQVDEMVRRMGGEALANRVGKEMVAF